MFENSEIDVRKLTECGLSKVFAEHGYRDFEVAKCQHCTTAPFWIALGIVDLEGFQTSIIIIVLIDTISKGFGRQETARNLPPPLLDACSQLRTIGRAHYISNQKIPTLWSIRTGNGPSGQPWHRRLLQRRRSTCLKSVSFAPLRKSNCASYKKPQDPIMAQKPIHQPIILGLGLYHSSCISRMNIKLALKKQQEPRISGNQ